MTRCSIDHSGGRRSAWVLFAAAALPFFSWGGTLGLFASHEEPLWYLVARWMLGASLLSVLVALGLMVCLAVLERPAWRRARGFSPPKPSADRVELYWSLRRIREAQRRRRGK